MFSSCNSIPHWTICCSSSKPAASIRSVVSHYFLMRASWQLISSKALTIPLEEGTRVTKLQLGNFRQHDTGLVGILSLQDLLSVPEITPCRQSLISLCLQHVTESLQTVGSSNGRSEFYPNPHHLGKANEGSSEGSGGQKRGIE